MFLHAAKGPKRGDKIDSQKADKYGEMMLTVQIPKSEIYGRPEEQAQQDEGPIKQPQKFSERFRSSLKSPLPSKKDPRIPIRMTKTEFMTYFVKDEKTGDYRADTIEPPGGRKAWLQARSPENDPEQWDLQLRESRQLMKTRGVGYLGGIANPYG